MCKGDTVKVFECACNSTLQNILSKGSGGGGGWQAGHLKQESSNKSQKVVWTRDNEKDEL